MISGLSKFLVKAIPPLIAPAVPPNKSGFDVNVSKTLTNSVNAFVAPIIKSVFAKLLINDVHALESLFKLPCQLFADFSPLCYIRFAISYIVINCIL